LRSGFRLSLLVAGLDVWRGFTDIWVVDPSQTAAYLLKVSIYSVNEYDGQRSPISIQAVSFGSAASSCFGIRTISAPWSLGVQLDLATKYEIAQILLGSLTECLRFFRSVNVQKPYSEQLVISHEHFDRVAIGNADDFGRDDRRSPRAAQSKQ
jgi:hypothetical protein